MFPLQTKLETYYFFIYTNKKYPLRLLHISVYFKWCFCAFQKIGNQGNGIRTFIRPHQFVNFRLHKHHAFLYAKNSALIKLLLVTCLLVLMNFLDAKNSFLRWFFANGTLVILL